MTTFISEKEYLEHVKTCLEYHENDINPPEMEDLRILQITVEENNDLLINVDKENNEYVKMLPSPIASSVVEDDRHSLGFRESRFIRKGLFDRLVMSAQNLNILLKPKKQLIIYIFEGLQLESTQRECLRFELLQENPDIEEENLERIITQIIFANKHKTTGGFVDIRVGDDSLNFLDMGEFKGIDLDKSMTYSKKCSSLQRNNRNVLIFACSFSGLVNYPYQWYTFCFGTRYHCYYSKIPTAVYDSIKSLP